MDSKTFRRFLVEVLIPVVEAKGMTLNETNSPATLIADGSLLKYDVEAIATSKGANIHLVILPPTATYIMQPMDISIFKDFKQYFAKFRTEKGGRL